MNQGLDRGLTPLDDARASPLLAPAGNYALADQISMVERSHQRSAGFGLQVGQKPDLESLARTDLAILLAQNQTLHNFAVPVMETMFRHIRHTHSMVILTDAHGTIMHALGEDDFLYKAEKLAIRPGVTWSEQSKGTNAIGTAIAEKCATRIHAKEHFLSVNRTLTCSATPIFDHHANVVGVLDITGDYRSVDKHTMALVKMSAQIIENQLFTASFNNAITLHFHRRAELIGTPLEAIASFTPGGRFLSANREAIAQLGLSSAALQAHTFSSLFDLPLSGLLDHHRSASPTFLHLFQHNGQEIFARIELRLERGMFQLMNPNYNHSMDGIDRKLTDVVAPPASSNMTSVAIDVPTKSMLAAHSKSHLHILNTGDEKMAQAIDKVSKVLGHA
ncbi:MAG TPA: GAF domain-containing protein, partial [Burkholderiaceae bacterium]|nr:GAF domain-containing protein [Burkholderiaceae bacterium]